MVTATAFSVFLFATFAMMPPFVLAASTIFAATSPNLALLNPTQLAQVKNQLQSGEPALQAALQRLQREANNALKKRPESVTEKQSLPPSGDKHDYMSSAPYWWPNPQRGNGLPYVRRDGEINPERDRASDRFRLEQLIQSVKSLGLAYYFIGNEAYADHAATLVQVWFLDETTRMNPHLRYAQSVPGRNHGRPEGIIETHNLPELIDAVGLLKGSKAWTQADHDRLRVWFDAYLIWLRDSPEGRTESMARNNHGTWYDVQVASFAMFVGRNDLARQIMEDFAVGRIAKQIEPDGRQPHELARTRAWHYSIFNLEAFFNAAILAQIIGIDLWHYETGNKGGIRKALDWLIPFATGEKKWTYKEIAAFETRKLVPLLRQATVFYREPRYEQTIRKVPQLTGDERWRLLVPAPIN
jgi:hypothetical protein